MPIGLILIDRLFLNGGPTFLSGKWREQFKQLMSKPGILSE